MQAAVDSVQADLHDFDEVVRLHWPRVHRFVLASLRDPDAAKSVTQDCFLRAYQGRERFRGESSVATWLMQIAVNLVRDYGRNRRLQFWRRLKASAKSTGDIGDHFPDAAASPEARLLLKEQVRLVWQACGVLPERQRTVFLLRYVEDMDLLEIATAMGMKEGTVKIHLFRAVQAVRKRLGSEK